MPCTMMMHGLCFQCALIDSSDTGAVHVGSGRDQGRRYGLAVLRTGVNRDAAGIDALLLHQVVLGVDSALSSEVLTVLLGAGGVADECELRIRRLLQLES